MVKCTFCGREAPANQGVHYILNNGTVMYLCSSKCRKNATKLKRDKRKIRWTDAFHETREKTRVRLAAQAEKAKEKAAAPKTATKKAAKKASK